MNVMVRSGLGLAIALTPVALPLLAWKPAVPYNSEEHRLIVDLGVSDVQVPASVLASFPSAVQLGPISAKDYVDGIRAAKQLAVGFESNTPSEYHSAKEAVQDNCYVTKRTVYVPLIKASIDSPYHQAAYNKKIYVPSEAQAPTTQLTVEAYNAAPDKYGVFTMGQLAALYGDYRRTTFCDNDGKCWMTDADVTDVMFRRGNEPRLCPGPMHAGRYLQHIGSGLVPPMGGLGNLTENTAATERDFFEAGWWGDEMLRIANINEWHFSNAAVAWYVGMHRLALLYVDSARSNSKYWTKALHYEANALHSLTDLFAYGHVITNRDETSYGIMSSISDHPGYKWMTHVLTTGGARRNDNNRIDLLTRLPAIVDRANIRNDFRASYNGTWLLRSNAEREYHDSLNIVGARVRNLNGDEFQIYGDGKLRQMLSETAATVIRKAVSTSVQSLFTAYDSLQKGAKVDDLGVAGSFTLAALKYLPVYIVRDGAGFYTGYWTTYASAVNSVSGVKKSLSKLADCTVPYLSGKDWSWPGRSSGTCASF